MTNPLDLFEQVVQLIEKDSMVLTYKSISRKLRIPIDDAKEVLAKYLHVRQGKAAAPLHVMYMVTHSREAEDGTVETRVILAHEKTAIELEDQMPGCSKHVFSVHSVAMDDPVSFYSIHNSLGSTGFPIINSRVGPRNAAARSVSQFPTGLTMDAKCLIKMEAAVKSCFADAGRTIEALRVKTTATKGAAVVGQPTAKTGAASWVKAGGLDNKKPTADNLKVILDKRIRTPSPRKIPAQESDSDDDFAAPRKRVRRPNVAVNDSDSEPEMPSVAAELNSFDEDGTRDTTKNSQHADEWLRSQSPDEPRVIRRKRKQSGTLSSSDVKAAAKSVSFGLLTSVSDDDHEDDASSEYKEQSISTNSRKITKNSSSSTKKARKSKNSKDADFVKNDDDGESGTASTRRSSSTGKKSAPTGRKRARKGEEEELSECEENRERSPIVEKVEPLRQFLAATSQSVTQERSKRPVRVQRVDEEGYTVYETVWKEVPDEESSATPKSDMAKTAPKDCQPPKVNTKSRPASKAPAKKSDTAKGKGVQSSIMSFFKKN